MNFHIKDDFQSGAPISQVPASWFNSVARFLNNLVEGWGIHLVKDMKGTSYIELKRDVLPKVSRDVGTPTDVTDSPTVLDTSGESLVWTAGGSNGLELDAYCKIAPQSSGSNYSVFQRCRLTYSKDGLLTKAELLEDRIRIRAANT